MTEEFKERNRNYYEGNGWSKYQLMVLQQLDDHNKVLQNLNKEIVDIKQTIAVSETEQKMWKAQIVTLSEELTKKLNHILYDDAGVSKKLSLIEKAFEIKEQTAIKVKATWAFYGAIIMFIIDVLARIFPTLWK